MNDDDDYRVHILDILIGMFIGVLIILILYIVAI